MPDTATQPTDTTQLLQAAAAGDSAAAHAVYERLYADLRRIARAKLHAPGVELSELNTTALVHEAYLRLWGTDLPTFTDTNHFLSYAARTMRSVVVDLVRARQAECRGGDAHHTHFDTQLGECLAAPEEEVLHVHAALAALEETEPRLARVVELRYFGGLTDTEVGALLGVTERTVQRDWQKARLFLARYIRLN